MGIPLNNWAVFILWKLLFRTGPLPNSLITVTYVMYCTQLWSLIYVGSIYSVLKIHLQKDDSTSCHFSNTEQYRTTYNAIQFNAVQWNFVMQTSSVNHAAKCSQIRLYVRKPKTIERQKEIMKDNWNINWRCSCVQKD